MQENAYLNRHCLKVEKLFHPNSTYYDLAYKMYKLVREDEDYREAREEFRAYVKEQTGVFTYYPTDWIIYVENAVKEGQLGSCEFCMALYGITILAVNNKWLSEVSNTETIEPTESDYLYKSRQLQYFNTPVKYYGSFKRLAEVLYYEIFYGFDPYKGAGTVFRDYIADNTGVTTYYPTDWLYEIIDAVKEREIEREDFIDALYGVTLLAVNNGWTSETTTGSRFVKEEW